MATAFASTRCPRFGLLLALLLGAYLTARGYRSFEGDQSYRLPLLLHRIDPSLYADDPFVRALDQFNPHVGYLALLAAGSRLIGLEGTLFALWVAAFVAMAVGIGRLARIGTSGERAAVVAVALVLLARAGNIGTNHLFEPILLDRLIVLGLGWLAIARSVARPEANPLPAAALLAAGAVLHPSFGLLLIGLMGAGHAGWALLPRAARPAPRATILALVSLGLAMVPALLIHGAKRSALLAGMPLDEFRLISFQVQGPQHLIPHLWRTPQWLAWLAYPCLAALAWWRDPDRADPARLRHVTLLAVNLALVALAWIAVEVIGDTTLTLLQPFRLATVTRGLCLAIVAGHLVRLWGRGDAQGRLRALLLAAGVCVDQAMLVASLTELAFVTTERTPRPARWFPLLVLAAGLWWLTRHDPERGYLPLLVAVAAAGSATIADRRNRPARPRPTILAGRRWAFALAAAWAVPMVALAAGFSPIEPGSTLAELRHALVDRCRFTRVPTDDVEKLADWCRDHTPSSARFIGPPGPKSFRLWSERAVAFNRAASPYHAAGLADWSERFRLHTGFEGTTADFARAYLRDRHGLEAGFARLTPAGLATLARSQGAGYLLAGELHSADAGAWEALRTEGRYTVYRLRDAPLAHAEAIPDRE